MPTNKEKAVYHFRLDWKLISDDLILKGNNEEIMNLKNHLNLIMTAVMLSHPKSLGLFYGWTASISSNISSKTRLIYFSSISFFIFLINMSLSS